MSSIGIDYRTQYEAAEERIRELEAELAKWQAALEEIDRFLSTVPGTKHGALRIEQLQSFFERISKAREILQRWHDVLDPQSYTQEIRKKLKAVLEALEGK